MERGCCPVFPLELLEIIIGFLEEDEDIESLKSWALTSRSLVHRSQSSIFKTVKLLPDPSRHDWYEQLLPITSRFIELLESNPALALYIRTLYYCARRFDYYWPDIANALRKLTGVKKLVLTSRMGTDEDAWMNWIWLDGSVRSALEDIITSPSLVELHLSSVYNFPALLIGSVQNLQNLTLHHIEFTLNTQKNPKDLKISSLCLSSLTIDADMEVGLHQLADAEHTGVPILDLAHLSALTIRNVGDMAPHIPVLQRMQNLGSLTVEAILRPHFLPFEGVLLIKEGLRAATTFKAILRINSELREDPLSWVFNELCDWPQENVLERLDIELHIAKDASIPIFDSGPTDLNFIPEDPMFPSLRKITLNVRVEASKRGRLTMEQIEEIQQTQMLKTLEFMNSRGIDFQLSAFLVETL